MICPRCQHANRSAAKFCEECAAPLPRSCASCGAVLRATAKFCDECGTATGAAPVPTPAANADGTRKVVTVMFADLAGSTALQERVDAESARLFMEGYYRAMRGAVEQHGGRVAKLLGDGVMAVFGLPLVAEDDAIRAVRAAVDMQGVFRELADGHSHLVGKVGLRIAVNTGEVVAKDETELIGDPVNVAARLQDQARDGDVVIGESTRRLVATLVTLEPLGSLILKGRDEAVGAYRVVSLEKPASATTAAFVGRDDEVARLGAVYDAAVASSAARLAVLLGSPGLGKSRLIDEFARRHGETARILIAQCDAAGAATFAPLAKAIRAVLGLDDGATGEPARAAIAAVLPSDTDDAERARIAGGVAALLGGSPTSPEETFFVVRRFLSGLAAASPVILVIDDLHWAEPLLLDLVEHLVQWGGGVPLFVLVGARPELRDLRSTLATPGGLVADVVTLGGLDAGAAMRLAANVIGAADLPAAVAVKVLAASEGNPLFVGELVRMLVQEGALTKEGDRWTIGAGLAALEMPPTIHALLAARIERLRPEDRTVLERAAVVGRHFSRSAVAALLGRNGSELDTRLESLRRSELIERDTGWLLGEPALRFHHVLIRDAAYRRLLKGTRAELHERLADWIEAQVGDAPEHDEMIGWHFEQAHQHLRELGSLDGRGRRLGERASQRLAAAGRRALARDDVPLAASLLGRAIDRLAPDAPERADLALDWCEALLSAGDVGSAGAAIDELGRVAADSARLRAWHTCFAGQLTVLTAPEALQTTEDRVGAAARDLAALGDAAGEAKAHFVHAQALARLGKVGACEAALDLALAAARRAGDRRRANAVLAGAPLAALWGPSPVTRASGRCLDVVRVLRITQGAPAVEAVALSCQGVLEALRGRTDAARRMIGSARTMVEELGIAHRLFEADAFAGRIDLLEGDAAAAERSLRGAYEGLRDLGLGIDAARAAALLARALLAQDQTVEAEALSHESETLAGDDLQAAIAWRGARAEALAKRGDHAAAVALAQAAVTIAAATDALLDHADARVALAAALRAAGRGAEADAEERRAIELWEAKGATMLAERARSDGEPVAPVTVTAEEPVPTAPARRRVRPNAATAMQARFDAALAARDVDAIAAVFDESHQEIDHPTGSTYGRAACIESIQRLLRSRDPHYDVEPLATLGESLLLVRRRYRAAGAASGRYDVGAYENEGIQLFEVDERGLCRRAEVFASNHLGDAIVRLYERYAELLPDGPARERAAATARAMATQSRGDHWAAVLAPEFESLDHRRLGTWSVRGAAGFLDHVRALREVASEIVFREHAVLALEPNAILVEKLHSGNDRLGGGAYERPFLALFATDVDGRLARAEWFDADHDAEALARFDALVAGATPKRSARRVRPNAATRNGERVCAAIERRDEAALLAAHAASMETTHHPTGATYGMAGVLALFRGLWRGQNLRLAFEGLGSLGDSLALWRHSYAHDGLEAKFGSVGPVEDDFFVLSEVDGRELRTRTEVFAFDRLGDAVARLYQRYAELLPDGPARERAAATARSVAVMVGPMDTLRWASVLGPRFETHDRRTLGLGLLDRDTYLRSISAILELSESISSRVNDVLAMSPEALVLRLMISGTQRDSGGAFERPFLPLLVLGTDGLCVRLEQFDADREADALARFGALVAGEMPTRTVRRVRPNAAVRNGERVCAAVEQRDAAALVAAHAASMETIHHPTGATYGMDGILALFRGLWRGRNLRLAFEALGSLGDSLALWHQSFAHDGFEAKFGSVGPVESEFFVLSEVDDHELRKRTEVFAADRLGDAVARLYERHAELRPDGPARARAGATARAVSAFHRSGSEPDLFEAAFAPGIVAIDHRTVGFGELLGREAVLVAVRTFRDLSDDIGIRWDDVLALSDHASVVRATQRGRARASGGAWERPICSLRVHDADGLVAHWEIFEAEQEAQALARYDALVGSAYQASSAPEPPFANAASRAWLAVLAAWAQRDAERFAALQPRLLRYRDHRRLFHLDLDREQFLAFTRPMLDMAVRASADLLATRGERLALMRSTFDMAEDAIGPSAIDSLLLIETDERGDIIAYDRFDLDDVDAAWAELDARWVAGEAAAHGATAGAVLSMGDVITRRDWDAYAALFAPGVGLHDHRVLGWGTTLADAATLVRAQQALVELAPDAHYRLDHLRVSGHAHLTQLMLMGTRDGGPFESPFVSVGEHDAAGRLVRWDLYDVDQLDQARARFEALAATADPLADIATPNAAFSMLERWQAAFGAAMASDDWDAIRGLCAEGMIFADRRRMVLLSGDRDLMIASARERARSGGRIETRIVGLAGERVVVSRALWSGGPPEGRWEVEYLSVIESDEAGKLAAMLFFDLDDARAALREAWARWAAIDTAVAPWVALVGTAVDAFDAHDGERTREQFADDVVVDDHRRTGFGRLEGADAYVQSLAVLWDLAPDQRMELGWFWPAVERHGVITVLRRSGTLAEGGAFESEHLWLCAATGGRITRLELFELEDLEKAKARLEELRPDPLRIPPNAVTRTWDRWSSAVAADDRDAIRALYAPAYRFDDRRPLFRMSSDLGETLAGDYLILTDGWWPVRTLLATAGDRLALQHILWTTGEAGATSEIETLMVSEVDRDGRFVHGAAFDPDDRAAASTELFERYAASGAAGLASNVIEIGRAWNAHDLEQLRAFLPDHFYLDDRRRTGVGRLEGLDTYLDSLSAMWELSRDLRIETLRIIGTAAHGTLYVCRWSGTNAEGGDFDAVYVCIGLLRGNETAGLEIFELDDIELARARFAELAP